MPAKSRSVKFGDFRSPASATQARVLNAMPLTSIERLPERELDPPAGHIVAELSSADASDPDSMSDLQELAETPEEMDEYLELLKEVDVQIASQQQCGEFYSDEPFVHDDPVEPPDEVFADVKTSDLSTNPDAGVSRNHAKSSIAISPSAPIGKESDMTRRLRLQEKLRAYIDAE